MRAAVRTLPAGCLAGRHPTHVFNGVAGIEAADLMPAVEQTIANRFDPGVVRRVIAEQDVLGVAYRSCDPVIPAGV